MTKAGHPLALDSRVRRRLSRFAQPPPGDWPEVTGCSPRAARRRWAKVRPADLPIPPQVPVLWVPSAVVARLAQEYGFAIAPHIGFRRWLFTQEIRQLAADRLGIRVQRPRSLARCPSCQRWVAFYQLEGCRWACRHCVPEPCQGLMLRIAWLAAYLRSGVFDRNVRGLRRRLVLRLMDFARRAERVPDRVLLHAGLAVVGPWPLDWQGPRGPRRAPGARRPALPGVGAAAHGPVHNAPGPIHRALAPFWVDALIDSLLDRDAFAQRFAT